MATPLLRSVSTYDNEDIVTGVIPRNFNKRALDRIYHKVGVAYSKQHSYFQVWRHDDLVIVI